MQLSSDTGIPVGFRLIEGQLVQVRNLIDQQLCVSASPASAKTPQKMQIVSYLRRQIRMGKMLRPGLVLLSYQLVRDGRCTAGREADTDCTTNNADLLVRVAAIIEMIHNATLLHDDVIDQGQKRRSRPTINSLWGNESAVLLGDLLLSRVFSLCTELEPRLATVIADATARTCEGELRQMTGSKDWNRTAESASEDEYINIITEKSAALFSSACLLGSLLAQADKTQGQSLADFGLNVGIAFQIADDLIDIVGDESKTGKTLGSDVDRTKLTLAVIHLLKMVDEREKGAVIEKLSTPGQNKKALTEMLSSSGSLEYAFRRAEEFAAKGVHALADFEKNEARDALIETADFMAGKGRIPHP